MGSRFACSTPPGQAAGNGPTLLRSRAASEVGFFATFSIAPDLPAPRNSQPIEPHGIVVEEHALLGLRAISHGGPKPRIDGGEIARQAVDRIVAGEHGA